MKDLFVLLGSALVLLSGCGEIGGGIACTDDFRYGLTVTVLDDASGQRICDATVVAKDGTHSETLMPFALVPDCTYSGAGERAGTYELTATKMGFKTTTQAGITVTRDTCHVKGVTVTLRLMK